MTDGEWTAPKPYKKPTVEPSLSRQVAVVDLGRGNDWVELLTSQAKGEIAAVRDELKAADLTLPTSTPDLVVVALPEACWLSPEFSRPLENIGHSEQARLKQIKPLLINNVEPGQIILAIALKKSLRSDRLYQPLYEANIMQLLLEGELDAPQVDFEVHTLASAGTRAETTYSAASLAAVARRRDSNPPNMHRAVRALYEPAHAQDLIQRFYRFLDERMALIPA